jgi:DNA-binding PadR family transcriptional regulator
VAGNRKVSNPLALTVLSYLSRGPMHPYDMVRTLRDNADGRSVKFTPASVYMVVQQLAKAGFVAEHETLRTGMRPERTTYAMTKAGREEWHHWLRELIEDPRHEYPQFVVALSLLAALPPGEVADLLRERAHRVAQVRAETQAMINEAVAGGLAPLFLVDEEYRVALLDAETAFLERLIERITDPENGLAGPWTEHLNRADLP